MILDKTLDVKLSNTNILKPYRLNAELSSQDIQNLEHNWDLVPFDIVNDIMANPDKLARHDTLLKSVFSISQFHKMFSRSMSWGVPESPGRIIHFSYGSIRLAFKDIIWERIMQNITPHEYDKFLQSDKKGNGYTYFNIDLMDHIS